MPPSVAAFIDHWSKADASERANAQSFLIGLTQLLGVPQPSNSHEDGYSFEHPVKMFTGHAESTGFIDLYRRGCFVWENKQFVAPKEEQSDLELVAIKAGAIEAKKKAGPVRGTTAWDDAMIRARGQAERYVRALPASEPNPPFIIVCDVGHSFELYADFTQAGKAYLPFPDPRSFRIRLKDLADEKVRQRLALIWTAPASLDPAKQSADVTREIAGYLAELAKSLEKAGHQPDVVAQFLTRCLFCMFAEDVGLLPERSFTDLLESLPGDGSGFVDLVTQLFREMNTGTGKSISVVLRKKLLQFNGGLFADDTVLPINGMQLGLLKQAAKQNWSNVEPAIFGTLLERALNPDERHQLGAHYTPRAYVERLVLPTVIEPLRSEWENVRAAAITHASRGDLKKARAEVNAFHDRLCEVKVLDPACGSGNFLYVSLQHLKVLEGEILDFAAQHFQEQARLELETHTIDPHQFLGIELNPRAASIAELVLWIGYLQWHFKLHGQSTPPEPILRAFKNIQCRDAVLEFDGEPEPARDEGGNAITVWDRRSMKTDLVTGRLVPDDTQRVPLLTYKNPRPASWPAADYIVGNPPFIGTARMREDLGDGYAETLRATYPEVPESADFVLYWWHKAAELVRSGKARRFGLITTNSLRQTFARRVVQHHLGCRPSVSDGQASAASASDTDALQPLSLVFAIPDHPWVDTAEGAAVRIAMTVGVAGTQEGELLEVTDEQPSEDGVELVKFSTSRGQIKSSITIGVDFAGAEELRSNLDMSFPGIEPHGKGFVISEQEAAHLGLGKVSGLANHIRRYRNGRDLTEETRGVMVIDLYGLSEVEVRQQFPTVYQHILTTVKPERDVNPRPMRRDNWWIFGEPCSKWRRASAGLPRFIATVKTSKHRIFQFLDSDILPDSKLINIASDDAHLLGVLSSRIHCVWTLAVGSRLGVGNDPTYVKSASFDKFPFPLCGEEQKDRIRQLAEAIDAHRKRAQSQHGLTLTGLYNVLEKLRAADAPDPRSGTCQVPSKPDRDSGIKEDSKSAADADESQTALGKCRSLHLTDKEKLIHDKGLVSILKQLHDDLDAAVFAAYGWVRGGQPETTLTDAEILERLVKLNAERAAEEKRGIIHWLRPDYQKPKATGGTQTTLDLTETTQKTKGKGPKSKVSGPKSKTPWPKPLAERIRAVETALHANSGPVTAEEMTKQFSRANTKDVQEILETLVTLGRAQRDGERFGA